MKTASTKKNPPRTRKMRIYYEYFSRKHGKETVFPKIRLCGRWLMESGFEVGQDVRITYTRNKIEITLATEEED